MSLLAGTLYDPGTAASKDCASRIAMTAMDTTNLRLTFTAPASGKVLVKLEGVIHGSTAIPQILLGVLESTTVKGRKAARTGYKGTIAATDMVIIEAEFLITGLTPGTSYTYDAAYGVETEVASTAIKYGGPNDTTANNAFGGFRFEIWGA